MPTPLLRWVVAITTMATVAFALVDEVRGGFPMDAGVALFGGGAMVPALVFLAGIRRRETTVVYGLVLLVVTSAAWLPPPMYSVEEGGGMEYTLVPFAFLLTLVTTSAAAVHDRRYKAQQRDSDGTADLRS